MILRILLYAMIGIALIEAGVIALTMRALRVTARELQETRQIYPVQIYKPPDAIIFDEIQAEDDERVKIYTGGLQNGG